MPGGMLTEIHADGEQTGGRFCMVITEDPDCDWALARHHHEHESETIHVISGRMEMTVGTDTTELGPGDSIHIPAGTPHSGSCIGDEPGRRLVVFSPAGIEGFFRAIGSPSPGEVAEPETIVAATQQYGWVFD